LKQNITIALDKEILRKARVLAVERSTSVSGLVAQEIERLVSGRDRYEQARREALADLERGYDLGSNGRLPARDELYDV
jgi:hypothetical protein